MECNLHLLLIGRRDAESPGARLELPEGSLADVAGFEAILDESAGGLRLAGFDAIVVDARDAEPTGAPSVVAQVIGRLIGLDRDARVVAIVEDGDEELAVASAGAGAWSVSYASELARELPRRLLLAGRMRRLLRGGEAPEATAAHDAEEKSAPPPLPAAEEEAPVVTGPDDQPLEMVGTSEAIRRIFVLIRQVAPSDVPVLITGENGTGKELAALAIHERSERAESPFVAINCAAIPEHLLESELFGYEKGAFTGATQARKGRFEAAQGGTLFLDEVGDLAPLLQVKLLRFLQDHLVERLGGRTAVPLDVRVIAATNRDITGMVQKGEFREDLYFRLAVFTVHMPPLRERGEDVVLMARHYLQRYGKDAQPPVRGYASDAIEALLEHRWPGNVRELINRVRRAVVVTSGPLLSAIDLGLEAPGTASPIATLREARREVEARVLRAALRRASWNKVEAAHLLGISRAQLYELIAKHQIPPHEWG